jgi:15-cis-phytoene synthase
MDDELANSFRYCRSVARREAKNFYYSFLVLPAAKRNALCAVYAFMRYCDDIADTPGAPATKRGYLDAWQEALAAAMRGECSGNPILPAFRVTVERYAIPPRLFEELIAGAAMDLTPRRYATFDELREYCYRVASVVGLVCIRIFGYEATGDRRQATDRQGQLGSGAGGSPETRTPPLTTAVPPDACRLSPVASPAERHAEQLGIAFQLTNILRDIPEDAAMGRVYLPLEDLAAFDYPEADLLAGVVDERFLKLVQFEAQRAREYYEMARPLLPMLHPSSRPCLAAMYGIYGGILDRIERQGYNVYTARARLSTWQKLGVAASSWVRYGLSGR